MSSKEYRAKSKCYDQRKRIHWGPPKFDVSSFVCFQFFCMQKSIKSFAKFWDKNKRGEILFCEKGEKLLF